MNRYLHNFVTRCIAILRAPRTTLITFGSKPPLWRVPLRDHLLPLAVIQLPTLIMTLDQVRGSSLGTLFFAPFMVLFILLQGGLAAGLLMALSRFLGGRKDFNASFVLYTLSATPQALVTFVFFLVTTLTTSGGLNADTLSSFTQTLLLVYTLAALAAGIFSLVLIHIGGEVILRIPPDKRFAFIGLWTVGLIILSILFLGALPDRGPAF